MFQLLPQGTVEEVANRITSCEVDSTARDTGNSPSISFHSENGENFGASTWTPDLSDSVYVICATHPCWTLGVILQLRRLDLSPVHWSYAATMVQPRINGMQREPHGNHTNIPRDKQKTFQKTQKKHRVILRYEWLVPKCESAIVGLSCQVGFTVPPHDGGWSRCRSIGDWIVFSWPGFFLRVPRRGWNWGTRIWVPTPIPNVKQSTSDWATKIARSDTKPWVQGGGICYNRIY